MDFASEGPGTRIRAQESFVEITYAYFKCHLQLGTLLAKKFNKVPALAELAFSWARGTMLINKKTSGHKNYKNQGVGIENDR